MQGCPLSYNNSKNYNLLEEFSSECSPTNDGKNTGNGTGDGTGDDNDWYENVRATNLEQVDSSYNQYLAEYLNEYNRYLVLKGLQKNSDPSSGDTADFTKTVEDSAKNVWEKKKKLAELVWDIQKNNQSSQELINNQNKDIENKTMSIQQKNNLISEQTKVIDERNRIMNSRSRQIQIGVEKNIYKRNIMYFLIFVNVIVIIILFSIIHKG